MRVNLQLMRKNFKVRPLVTPRQRTSNSAKGGNSKQQTNTTDTTHNFKYENSPRSLAQHKGFTNLKVVTNATDSTKVDSLCLPDIRKSPTRATSASASRRLAAADYAAKIQGSFYTNCSDDDDQVVLPPTKTKSNISDVSVIKMRKKDSE